MSAKLTLSTDQLSSAASTYGDGAALAAVAKSFAMSAKALGRIFKENGIEVRAPSETLVMRSALVPEELAKCYADGQSIGTIARALGTSQTAVRGALLRSGIELRRVGARNGSANHQFKGGTVTYDNGYVSVRGARKAPHQHRLIAEQAIGRKLRSTEVVHHINGDKTDNRNSNLLVCSQSYHAELHARIKAKYGTYNHPFNVERT